MSAAVWAAPPFYANVTSDLRGEAKSHLALWRSIDDMCAVD
ncbi:hypothetical protein [uncultured Tateyamaria sp.]|nr:hypothetical protein [uncultured Tateyamaria sp.]